MSTKLIKSGKALAKTKMPKTDSRYWEGAIFKPRFSPRSAGGKGLEENDGQPVRKATLESKLFSMRIHFQGERLTIPLGLANKAAAARRARDIYMSLITCGRQETLAKFHPKHVDRIGRPTGPEAGIKHTVGDYIVGAKEFTGVAPRTISGYVTSLRMIAAGVAGIKAGKAKFDYKRGGHEVWRAKVDSVPLALLTATAVEAWKHRYFARRKGNPVEERKARNSVNSFIRQARSLFAPKIVKHLESRFQLPNPLPFQGVGLFPRSSMRYVSRINIRTIVTAARDELGATRADGEATDAYTSRTEQFKIFLLAAFGGLRRNEIDKLLWSQVDLAKGVVEIRETPHFKPKSEDSCGQIEIEPEVTAFLTRFRRESGGEFVVGATGGIKKTAAVQWYRAKGHFDGLLDWLRKQGISDLKPLHVLRKEAGNLVCGTQGLHAASRFLRHGDVRVTAEHYLDRKPKVTVGMGGLLGGEAQTDGADTVGAGGAEHHLPSDP